MPKSNTKRANPKAKPKSQTGVVTQNRRAYHDYEILETVEAGLALTGTEIKSVRSGKMNIQHAFAKAEDGEVWLVNSHIAPYEQGNIHNHEPTRPRKLLLHAKEIGHLSGADGTEGADTRAPASVHQGPLRQGAGRPCPRAQALRQAPRHHRPGPGAGGRPRHKRSSPRLNPAQLPMRDPARRETGLHCGPEASRWVAVCYNCSVGSSHGDAWSRQGVVSRDCRPGCRPPRQQGGKKVTGENKVALAA